MFSHALFRSTCPKREKGRTSQSPESWTMESNGPGSYSWQSKGLLVKEIDLLQSRPNLHLFTQQYFRIVGSCDCCVSGVLLFGQKCYCSYSIPLPPLDIGVWEHITCFLIYMSLDQEEHNFNLKNTQPSVLKDWCHNWMKHLGCLLLGVVFCMENAHAYFWTRKCKEID